jgi:hypothetical protein
VKQADRAARNNAQGNNAKGNNAKGNNAKGNNAKGNNAKKRSDAKGLHAAHPLAVLRSFAVSLPPLLMRNNAKDEGTQRFSRRISLRSFDPLRCLHYSAKSKVGATVSFYSRLLYLV